MRHPARQRGLTLVELLIAMTLGLLLTAAMIALFLQSQRSQRQNAQIQGLQDQARFALQQLSRDLAMAGYWGGVYGGASIAVSTGAAAALPSARDCGAGRAEAWAFATDSRVEFRNHAEPGTAASRFGCLQDVQPDTDVLAMRRVAGQETARALDCTRVLLRPRSFYLKTNGTAGTLIRTGADPAYLPCVADEPVAPPAAFHKIVPRVYYVRNWTRRAGDRRPTLCRRELQHAALAEMADECLAEGVEDFQVSWGLDTDADGAVDRYTPAPAQADMALARTAQIFLLLRGARGDRGYLDEKSYALADHVYEPAAVVIPGLPEPDQPAHYLRRVFTTTVQLRNAAL